MARRRVARRGARGGEDVQALRQAGTRVATGVAALGCAVGLAALPLTHAEEDAVVDAGFRIVAVALLALVVALVLEWPLLVPVPIVLLGGLYGAQLAIDDAPLDTGAALFAVGALLMAELAFWSLEERERIKGEPGEGFRRLAFVALLGLGGVVAASLLLALVDEVGTSGLGIDLLGAAAAAAALLAIVLSARARES